MTDYNKYNVVDGHYDWLHPDELQTQYIFHLRDDAPFEKKSFGIVVTNLAEESFSSVYDCAVAVWEAVDEYVHHPDKDKVRKLVTYLEKYMYEDRLQELLTQRTNLLNQVERIDKSIAYVECEMELNRE